MPGSCTRGMRCATSSLIDSAVFNLLVHGARGITYWPRDLCGAKLQPYTGATYTGEYSVFGDHLWDAQYNKMIEIGRPSRLKGAGFYSYVDGKRVGLWEDLAETFNSGTANQPLQDMIDRMLFAEALETQKCLDEGVLTSTADANIGSIMGIGFPPYTGGSAQFIIGYQGELGTGKDDFVARAKELAAKYGDRFTPPDSLL